MLKRTLYIIDKSNTERPDSGLTVFHFKELSCAKFCLLTSIMGGEMLDTNEDKKDEIVQAAASPNGYHHEHQLGDTVHYLRPVNFEVSA